MVFLSLFFMIDCKINETARKYYCIILPQKKFDKFPKCFISKFVTNTQCLLPFICDSHLLDIIILLIS
jgi:hypothetical protein